MNPPAMLILLSCVAVRLGGSSAQQAEEKPAWHADWPTAQRIAKKEHKPIFAVLVCRH